MQVRVRKLDVEKIKPHRIILMLRSSGKTCLMRDILSKHRDRYDFVMAMCPTVESSSILKEHMPSACVYDRYMQSKVDGLVKIASDLAAQGKERHFLLVLDDVMYDKAICRTQSFRYLFYNGRHAKISVIILLQYLVDMPPDMRSQVDYVFTMKENTIQNRIKLYKMFFGVFQSIDDFSSVLDRCTQNFECLVLDQTLPVNGPADCIFWYKAKLDVGEFSLGKSIFYKLQKTFERPEPLTNNEMENFEEKNAGMKQKSKLKIFKDGEDEEDSKDER